MIRIAFIFLSIVIFVGCHNNEATKKVIKEQTTQVKKKKVKKKKVRQSGLISNDNLVEFLTDFAEKNPERYILIKTRLGDMKVKLYRDITLHSANFLMLAKDGYFDNTVFYRVVPGLVIQGGDTDEPIKRSWKKKLGSYRIPPEFRPKYIHKKGALAMSRSYIENPDKLSSSWDFYIVHGQNLTPVEMAKVPAAHKETYRQLGGAPHLDNEHTVFGEVVSGMHVIDKIVSQPRDRGDWPIDDVIIKMEVLQ